MLCRTIQARAQLRPVCCTHAQSHGLSCRRRRARSMEIAQHDEQVVGPMSRHMTQTLEDHWGLRNRKPAVTHRQQRKKENKAPVEEKPWPAEVLECPVVFSKVCAKQDKQRQTKHSSVRLYKAPPHKAVGNILCVPCVPSANAQRAAYGCQRLWSLT